MRFGGIGLFQAVADRAGVPQQVKGRRLSIFDDGITRSARVSFHPTSPRGRNRCRAGQLRARPWCTTKRNGAAPKRGVKPLDFRARLG